ncbi:hypothetical protein J1N35_045176 [Gossypium stocksii]|uniref:Uncharacterized protein n=1 Tax=Gossypium stocksii TaxID=47602 RepID=A0A9D3UAL0_9ROSI|nr:hypothetical protein J1N35_045176 [Gossypium stocksii]
MASEAPSWADQWDFEGIGSIKDEDAAIATKKMAARNPKDNVVMGACNDGPGCGDARRIGDGVEKHWRNGQLGIGWSG